MIIQSLYILLYWIGTNFVNRSGSMAGGRMNQTKNALQIFLRSLPVGTKFNSTLLIIVLHTTQLNLWPGSF